MLRYYYLLLLFFLLRTPVSAGLSLPWCPVGTMYYVAIVFTVRIVVPCWHFIFMYPIVLDFTVVSQNKLDWIGLV